MVNRIFSILKKEVSGLHEAAFLLGFFAIVSQALALVRDRLLAHLFGASSTLDVYYAAFRVPDLIYTSIASFVSLTVLIPFLSKYLSREGEEGVKEAKRFLGSVGSLFFAVVLTVSAVAFFAMPYLARFIAPGFGEKEMVELITLSRILLLSPIILGISNLFGSITQVFKQFFVYALAPVLYNAGIIAGILIGYPLFGLKGLVYGVILGALLHALIQFPVVAERRLLPRFSFNVDFKSVKEVIKLSLPRTVTLSVSLLSFIVLIAIATLIEKGSVSVLNLSFNLQSVPLSIVGVSYSLAAFPTLAGLYSRGMRGEFAVHIVSALRHIIFWSLPISALFIVLRAQIVRVVLGSGAFSWTDTRLTAAALALFIVSLVAQGAVLILVRGFYAAGETRIPLYINVFFAILTATLGFFLIKIFNQVPFVKYFTESLLRVDGLRGTSLLMLPFAYTIGILANAFTLWVYFESRYLDSIPKALTRTTFESFSAAIVSGFGAYLALTIFGKIFSLDTFWGIFSQGFFAGLIGIFAGVIVLVALKSEEFADIVKALRARFWKAEVIAPEPTEL